MLTRYVAWEVTPQHNFGRIKFPNLSDELHHFFGGRDIRLIVKGLNGAVSLLIVGGWPIPMGRLIPPPPLAAATKVVLCRLVMGFDT